MTCFLYGVEMKVGIHTHTHTHTHWGYRMVGAGDATMRKMDTTDLMESGKADTEQVIQHLCLQ